MILQNQNQDHNKMKKEIKSRLEIIPVLLVIESMVCFILSYFEFYENIFTHWEELTECSFLMCFVLYGISENWGFLAKKCIATLFILNSVNFCYEFLDTLAYYNLFQSVIYSFFILITIHQLCWKK